MAVAIAPTDRAQQAGTRDAWPPIGPSAQAPHVEQRVFRAFGAFKAHMREQLPRWPEQVQQALRLMALNGIVTPIEQRHVPAEALRVADGNFRETLEWEGCLSRHRAVLLVVQELLAHGGLPPREQLDLYCPEADTPFVTQLRTLFPRLICSAYRPEAAATPAAPENPVQHQDLCALTLSEASLDLVICNELFEHLHDLPAALSGIARVLRPGGHLVATCRFAYGRARNLVPDEALCDAITTLDPGGEERQEAAMTPTTGERVHQIPGWELLEQAEAAGLQDAAMHWIAAPSYGVVGQEIPAVMVMVARRL